jgi:DNA-binding protein YbaB
MIALEAQMEKDAKKRDWMIGQGMSIWRLTDTEMDMPRSVLQKKFHSGTLGYMVKDTRKILDSRKPQQGDLGFPYPNKPNYPTDTPQAYQGFGTEGFHDFEEERSPKGIKEQGKAELIKKIGADAYANNFNKDGSPKAWSPKPIDKKTLARNQRAALKLAKERRRYGGLTKAEWNRLSSIERRMRSGGSSGFADGYIPNFVSLTPDYSQFSWRNNDNSLNPYDRNFMMSTPGLRGLLNPNQSFGRTFANGLIPSLRSSQNRERMQSGRNDVYSRYVDTPKYSGMATFNGSERGREESIVRNHPNPKNAGATPNFASGTEAIGKLEKIMTNLNVQIASLSEKMAQVQSTGEGAQGQAQISMSPLNVNVNHSGRLTTQVEEIQSQISSAVNEAMKQIAPALWRTIRGPATS